jgi:hypothetical protein
MPGRRLAYLIAAAIMERLLLASRWFPNGFLSILHRDSSAILLAYLNPG